MDATIAGGDPGATAGTHLLALLVEHLGGGVTPVPASAMLRAVVASHPLPVDAERVDAVGCGRRHSQHLTPFAYSLMQPAHKASMEASMESQARGQGVCTEAGDEEEHAEEEAEALVGRGEQNAAARRCARPRSQRVSAARNGPSPSTRDTSSKLSSPP